MLKMEVLDFDKWLARQSEEDLAEWVQDCPLCGDDGPYHDDPACCPWCYGKGEVSIAYDVYLAQVERDIAAWRRWCGGG